ncbi:hypothetical protein [Tenacibaculum sp. UWU-22]|uniref:hypothetical protein n=1 Tax=Tenacibaculum sp. UWU-22 TaxID=3234187 RepID=UPI0034DB295C
MNFLKKLFNLSITSSKDDEIKEQVVNLSLEDSFVHNFIKKGGKFLYATKTEEVITNIKNILIENNWNKITCTDIDLLKFLRNIDVAIGTNFKTANPFFTTCEHLIASNGDILFSSNQLKSDKLPELSKDFIVYATTSQLVKNNGQALTGIKTNFKGNIPTNISAIRNYSIKNDDDNFLNNGSSNSKNLYLLLFEDL